MRIRNSNEGHVVNLDIQIRDQIGERIIQTYGHVSMQICILSKVLSFPKKLDYVKYIQYLANLAVEYVSKIIHWKQSNSSHPS